LTSTKYYISEIIDNLLPSVTAFGGLLGLFTMFSTGCMWNNQNKTQKHNQHKNPALTRVSWPYSGHTRNKNITW